MANEEVVELGVGSTLVTYYHEVANISHEEVSRKSCSVAAPLYQKQRNRSDLNKRLDCLA